MISNAELAGGGKRKGRSQFYCEARGGKNGLLSPLFPIIRNIIIVRQEKL